MKDSMERAQAPLVLIFPALASNVSMPWDADFRFNRDAIRNKLQSFTDERLKNPKANEEFDDILQYLLKDDYYNKN